MMANYIFNCRFSYRYLLLKPSKIFGGLQSPLSVSYARCSPHRCINTDINKEHGAKIYDGPLTNRVRAVKLFSFSTSFLGLLFQPMIIQKMIDDGLTPGIIFSGVIIQFFTFVTPFLLHSIIKKYVTVIYFDLKTDTYTAITFSFLGGARKVSFKVDDVVVPDIPGFFTSVVIKKVPLFIDASCFSDIHHYKRIMGYDKPIDFKLGIEEKPPKK